MRRRPCTDLSYERHLSEEELIEAYTDAWTNRRILNSWLWWYLDTLIRFSCALAPLNYSSRLSGAGLPLFGLTVPLPDLLSFLIRFAKNADIASLLVLPSSGPAPAPAAVRLIGVLTPPVPAPFDALRPAVPSVTFSRNRRVAASASKSMPLTLI